MVRRLHPPLLPSCSHTSAAANETRMSTPERRTEPVNLRIGAGDLTLAPADVDTLIGALEAERNARKRRLAQIERDRPQGLEATVRSIGALTKLAETFASGAAATGEPPLELDRAQADLVSEALAELRAHQRRELSSGLTELKRALYRL